MPPDSVWCTRENDSELLSFGFLGSHSAIIHRTVRCAKRSNGRQRNGQLTTLQCADYARRRTLNVFQSTVAREVVVAPLAHRTLSGASPDSPVNYSGVPSDFPEGSEFSVECPGASDSPVRQTRVPLGCLLLSLFEPFIGLFIGLL